MSMDAIQSAQLDFNIFTVNSQDPVDYSPAGSWRRSFKTRPEGTRKAQREYDKGYQMLLRKDAQGAVQHLGQSVSIYPKLCRRSQCAGHGVSEFEPE